MSDPIGSQLAESRTSDTESTGHLLLSLILAIILGAVFGIGLEGLRFVGGFLFIASQVVGGLVYFWPSSLGALSFCLVLLCIGVSQGLKKNHFLGLMPILSNVLWIEWGSFWFCRGGGGEESLAVAGSHGFFVLAVILALIALVLQKERRVIVVAFIILEAPLALACAFVVGMASSGTWL